MISWKIREEGFDPEKIAGFGNKFLTGNGYMGIRGTADEYRKEELAAVNIAGIYDRVGDAWREPLNAPNGLYAYLTVDGSLLTLKSVKPERHYFELDYRHGVFKRHTEWRTKRGTVSLETERFADMKDVHLCAAKTVIRTDFDADIAFTFGIDADVWDINGPHYDAVYFDGDDVLLADAVTHERQDHVYVSLADRVYCDGGEALPSGAAAIEEKGQNQSRLSERGEFIADAEALREKDQNSSRFSERAGFIDEADMLESRVSVSKEQGNSRNILKTYRFHARACEAFRVERFFGVYTSKDQNGGADAAASLVTLAENSGYDAALAGHKEVWERLWQNSQVVIEGDDKAMEALNYSCYHLHSIAPRHTDSLSIAARGLSGQTYKGAVFWDTEMFILDFFLLTEPEVAGKLMKYRIDTLPGAKDKARHYGYDGAFYAWESQEGGYDACSDYNVTDVFTGRPMRTYFKDKQIHISAAIVYGIARYTDLTGDYSLMSEGGAETVIECAKFYRGLLLKKVSGTQYELHDVIGPDEYHERVNNNGYTNRMAKYTFDQAVKVIDSLDQLKDSERKRLEAMYDFSKLRDEFSDAASHIYIPKPGKDGVIPQFDGYFDLEDASVDEVRSRLIDPKEYWGGANGVASHTQVIKQADVITWLNLFPDDTDDETKRINWEYYEPRTEHGSSLSACMYAMLACKCKKKERAYPFFMKSASADLIPGGKEWAGLVYIGGTHPAAAGGAYMVAVYGFGGISFKDGTVTARPNLPEGWRKMSFHVRYRGKTYKVDIEGDSADVTCEGVI